MARRGPLDITVVGARELSARLQRTAFPRVVSPHGPSGGPHDLWLHGTRYGDRLGRPHQGTLQWCILHCRLPECPAEVLVPALYVEEAGNRLLRTTGRTRP